MPRAFLWPAGEPHQSSPTAPCRTESIKCQYSTAPHSTAQHSTALSLLPSHPAVRSPFRARNLPILTVDSRVLFFLSSKAHRLPTFAANMDDIAPEYDVVVLGTGKHHCPASSSVTVALKLTVCRSHRMRSLWVWPTHSLVAC